jgi:hypothetical protein
MQTVDLIAPDALRELFRDWLTDSGTRAPPWELYQSHYIFATRQAQTLYDALQHYWTQNEALQRMALAKVFPASGASSLLRTVAFKEHQRGTLVLWISSVRSSSKAGEIAEVLRRAFSRATSSRVLICTDELSNNSSDLLLQALQHACRNDANLKPRDFKIFWLDLRASSLDEWSKSSPKPAVISPFVDTNDVDGLAHCLARAFPENSKALQMVSKLAKYSAEAQDSHVFVFALAASQGVSKSVTNWISDIYQQLRQNDSQLLRVALAFAFASAFAPTRSPKHRCISDGPIHAVSKEAANDRTFRTLFPTDSIPPDFDTTSCLHPFLARIFISNEYQLFWDHPTLDWGQLCEAWKNCVHVFQNHPKCHFTLKALISERNETIFSQFVSECWSSLISKTPQLTLSEISTKILDILPSSIMGFHSLLLKSRLARCAAQEVSKKTAREKFMAAAIKHAREALQSCGNNQGDLFMASQNLAIMLGVANTLCPSTFRDTATEAHNILRQLYTSAQPHDRADIVTMGIKWTGQFSPEWQKEALGTKHSVASPVSSQATRSALSQATSSAPSQVIRSAIPATVAPLEVQFSGWKFDPSLSRFWIFSPGKNAKKR